MSYKDRLRYIAYRIKEAAGVRAKALESRREADERYARKWWIEHTQEYDAVGGTPLGGAYWRRRHGGAE